MQDLALALFSNPELIRRGMDVLSDFHRENPDPEMSRMLRVAREKEAEAARIDGLYVEVVDYIRVQKWGRASKYARKATKAALEKDCNWDRMISDIKHLVLDSEGLGDLCLCAVSARRYPQHYGKCEFIKAILTHVCSRVTVEQSDPDSMFHGEIRIKLGRHNVYRIQMMGSEFYQLCEDNYHLLSLELPKTTENPLSLTVARSNIERQADVTSIVVVDCVKCGQSSRVVARCTKKCRLDFCDSCWNDYYKDATLGCLRCDGYIKKCNIPGVSLSVPVRDVKLVPVEVKQIVRQETSLPVVNTGKSSPQHKKTIHGWKDESVIYRTDEAPKDVKRYKKRKQAKQVMVYGPNSYRSNKPQNLILPSLPRKVTHSEEGFFEDVVRDQEPCSQREETSPVNAIDKITFAPLDPDLEEPHKEPKSDDESSEHQEEPVSQETHTQASAVETVHQPVSQVSDVQASAVEPVQQPVSQVSDTQASAVEPVHQPVRRPRANNFKRRHFTRRPTIISQAPIQQYDYRAVYPMCNLCNIRVCDVILLPCGHRCICSVCACHNRPMCTMCYGTALYVVPVRP